VLRDGWAEEKLWNRLDKLREELSGTFPSLNDYRMAIPFGLLVAGLTLLVGKAFSENLMIFQTPFIVNPSLEIIFCHTAYHRSRPNLKIQIDTPIFFIGR
jgi:hypothetical protein